jgi:hypothetical protein
MAFEVERYDAAARDAWDELVRSARARHFQFERGYMEYHADRFEDASLIVTSAGRPVALLPANRRGDEVVSHAGLTFGGLLSGPGLTIGQSVAVVGAVADALRADGVRRLTYKAVPHVYHVSPAEEDLYALAAHGAQLTGRDMSAVVARDERVKYSEERRRAVRRGQREDLELGPSGEFEAFMELERELLARRHGAEPVHSAAEIRLLADRFPDAIRLFAAHHAGELVAGVLVYETETVAHAQYIGASDRGRELRAQDALFDHLLCEVYAAKPWFDFGRCKDGDGRLSPGLARNKEGFGARTVVYDTYALALS